MGKSDLFSRADAVLIIPNARIDDVSAATGPFTVGPPSPLALCGLAHKLGLDAERAGVVRKMTVKGTGLLCHSFSVAPGHMRVPPEMPGEHNNKAGAMLDEPVGRLQASIVVAFDLAAGDDDAGKVAEWAAATLASKRLGGGKFVWSGVTGRGPDGKAVTQRTVICQDYETLSGVLRSLPAGSFLADRSDLFDGDAGGRDRLDVLLDALARVQVHPERAEGETVAPDAKPRIPTAWRRNQKGCLVPIDVGFRALSQVAHRSGLRCPSGTDGHAWVEGILSLGEWVPKSRATATGLDGCLWSYRTDGHESGIWTVGAHRKKP